VLISSARKVGGTNKKSVPQIAGGEKRQQNKTRHALVRSGPDFSVRSRSGAAVGISSTVRLKLVSVESFQRLDSRASNARAHKGAIYCFKLRPAWRTGSKIGVSDTHGNRHSSPLCEKQSSLIKRSLLGETIARARSIVPARRMFELNADRRTSRLRAHKLIPCFAAKSGEKVCLKFYARDTRSRSIKCCRSFPATLGHLSACLRGNLAVPNR